MAYFDCQIVQGGGGTGADLIVTCSQNFAGATITCTDGVDTLTQQCPSSSPYEVVFESIPTGTWTISGQVSGQTFSTTKTITDFNVGLSDIPEGSTATPTDVIQTWLHCANIWDKTYTTINQVLADSTTLLALISSNNAVDYMARSTSWASSVCANSTAMTYIGANNYCANALLDNSTWRTAICNSTYFENVLNVKVPSMTSSTTPSGQVFRSSEYGGDEAYKAFDGSSTSAWFSADNATTNGYIGYEFTQAVNVRKVHIQNYNSTKTAQRATTAHVKGSNDGSNWTNLANFTTPASGEDPNNDLILSSATKYRYFEIMYDSFNYQGASARYLAAEVIQFYGRA